MHNLQTAILKLWIHLKSMHEHWPVLWTLKLGMGTLINHLNYLTSVNKAQTSLYHKFVAFLWHHLTKPNGRLFSNKNFVSLKRPFGEQCWTIGCFWKNFGLIKPPLFSQGVAKFFTSKIPLLRKYSSQDIWQGWSNHLCKNGNNFQWTIIIAVFRIDEC